MYQQFEVQATASIGPITDARVVVRDMGNVVRYIGMGVSHTFDLPDGSYGVKVYSTSGKVKGVYLGVSVAGGVLSITRVMFI